MTVGSGAIPRGGYSRTTYAPASQQMRVTRSVSAMVGPDRPRSEGGRAGAKRSQRGYSPILQFLAAAELLEEDLWHQYEVQGAEDHALSYVC